MGRELTKRHECFTHGPLAQLAEQAEEGSLPARGEFVVCIEGVPASEQAASSSDADLDKLLDVLLLDCSLKSAVRIAVALTDEKKSRVYARALVRKDALG